MKIGEHQPKSDFSASQRCDFDFCRTTCETKKGYPPKHVTLEDPNKFCGVADGRPRATAKYLYARGVKEVAPRVCVTDRVTKAVRLQCRFSSISWMTMALSHALAGLGSNQWLNVPRLAPYKGHVFPFSIVNDESSNVHAKIFSDIHFSAKNLEC